VDFSLSGPYIRKDRGLEVVMSYRPPCPNEISHLCHRPLYVSPNRDAYDHSDPAQVGQPRMTRVAS